MPKGDYDAPPGSQGQYATPMRDDDLSAPQGLRDAPPSNEGRYAAPATSGRNDDLSSRRDAPPASKGRYDTAATTVLEAFPRWTEEHLPNEKTEQKAPSSTLDVLTALTNQNTPAVSTAASSMPPSGRDIPTAMTSASTDATNLIPAVQELLRCKPSSSRNRPTLNQSSRNFSYRHVMQQLDNCTIYSNPLASLASAGSQFKSALKHTRGLHILTRQGELIFQQDESTFSKKSSNSKSALVIWPLCNPDKTVTRSYKIRRKLTNLWRPVHKTEQPPRLRFKLLQDRTTKGSMRLRMGFKPTDCEIRLTPAQQQQFDGNHSSPWISICWIRSTAELKAVSDRSRYRSLLVTFTSHTLTIAQAERTVWDYQFPYAISVRRFTFKKQPLTRS
jgi:hypothetical protein